MFCNRRNVSKLSDRVCKWNPLEQKATLQWNLDIPGEYDLQRQIHLPYIRKYKYLGIVLSNKLKLGPHLGYIRRKINFVTNAFTSFRKHSKSVRFCHNTWQIFVRPLLDYAASYAYFVSAKDRKGIETLCRTSLRRMLFLKNYVPSEMMNSLIQYPYEKLPEEFTRFTQVRYEARVTDTSGLNEPIVWNYRLIPIEDIPHEIIACLNIYYYRGKSQLFPGGFSNPEQINLSLKAKLGVNYINPVPIFRKYLCMEDNDLITIQTVTDLYNQLCQYVS